MLISGIIMSGVSEGKYGTIRDAREITCKRLTGKSFWMRLSYGQEQPGNHLSQFRLEPRACEAKLTCSHFFGGELVLINLIL